MPIIYGVSQFCFWPLNTTIYDNILIFEYVKIQISNQKNVSTVNYRVFSSNATAWNAFRIGRPAQIFIQKIPNSHIIIHMNYWFGPVSKDTMAYRVSQTLLNKPITPFILISFAQKIEKK